MQPRQDYCSTCLTNPVRKENGCCNHVPSGGKIPRKKAQWSPHGQCADHVRTSTSVFDWTVCENSSIRCTQLSMQHGKGSCYSCFQNHKPCAREVPLLLLRLHLRFSTQWLQVQLHLRTLLHRAGLLSNPKKNVVTTLYANPIGFVLALMVSSSHGRNIVRLVQLTLFVRRTRAVGMWPRGEGSKERNHVEAKWPMCRAHANC